MPLYGDGNKDSKGYTYINKFFPRVDAKDKVTGRAKYAADLTLPNMLLGGALFSPYPHAQVTSVNTEKARSIPGVRAVLTFQDLREEVSWGYYTFMSSRLRYQGDVSAIVAAEDGESLAKGLAAIEIEYQELPAVFTVAEALAAGAPLVHEGNEECAGNIWAHSRYRARKGDAEAAFAQCDRLIERVYETLPVEHAYMETEAAVAAPDPTAGLMTVYTGAVNPYFTRRWVADALGVPRAKIRIVQQTVGGSFGGKEELLGLTASRAALLAQATDCPVKMVMSREQSIIASTKRHPFLLKYKVGVNNDGRLQAFQAELIENVGAFHMHEFMNFRASVHAAGVYNIPNVKVDVFGVFTNTVTAGAMRGYSSPQLIFGSEQLYEEVAGELGMDYVAFKRLNMLRPGDENACGQKMESDIILPEILDQVFAATDFERKRAAYREQQDVRRKGVGMAMFYRGCGLGAESPDASAGFVCVHDDGSVMINSGLVENGQGLKTSFTQIVAETLSIPPETIHFIGVDTHTIPDSGITAASRSTVMGAQSVKLAAEELRDYLLATAAMMFHAEPSQVELREGMFRLTGVPDAVIPFQTVCNVHHWTGQQAGVMRWFKPAPLSYDMAAGQGKAFPTYSYGCVVAEVEVDTLTGEVTVERVTCGHDLGTVINHKIVEGQIYGGVLMGQGFALMEGLAVKDGLIRHKNFDTYMIATALDLPEIRVMLFESDDDAGTYGAKSIGEPATEGVAAAIISAVKNATGLTIRQIPINKVSLLTLLNRRSQAAATEDSLAGATEDSPAGAKENPQGAATENPKAGATENPKDKEGGEA
ncbi:MAG: xanthine dehydrogenase family protein molybdopterin-binding subunit [Peptococcaceae bacterium]|jgi:CO/xanthine dehydrogenase Mo-binding subunit|nr:xanthine dehydrogenase family protein molybdopterin-binding subunit [Peptococcaceae bacterium]